MNYQKVYDSLIERAKARGLDKKKLEGYFEKHHIIPRCIGGLDENSNYVLLTGREHYLCHWLLWKIHKDNKLLFCAYHCMCYKKSELHFRRFKITSKQYEVLNSFKSNSMIGIERSKETKIRISVGKLSSNYKPSDETKNKISSSKKGTKAWNKDLKGAQRAWNAGMPNSIETREKITAGLIGLFKGSKNPNAKRCSIDGSIYECMKDAMNTYSISKYTLRNRLNSEKFENWFYL